MENKVLPTRLPQDFIWSSTGNKHVEYGPGEQFEGTAATFQGYDELGEGGQASVTVVKVKDHLLARKRMHIEVLNEECKREAEILENIVHRHIIQLVGSYTLNRRFYLLLHPVAECTLKELMATSLAERGAIWETCMKEAFGCLATAIAFLHSKRIAVKHKDIKPSNVLFLKGNPILTDFGLSNSFKGKEDSFSTGMTGKSVLYAAPEVIDETARGTSQDIFSLGLVFQDMFWALQGRVHIKPSDQDGAHRSSPFHGADLTQEQLEYSQKLRKLAFDNSPRLTERDAFVDMIRGMTARLPQNRPTAEAVSFFLRTNSTYFGKCCGGCCFDDHRLDQTTFQEWTGLNDYPHLQEQGPYDDGLIDRIRIADMTVRENIDDHTVMLARVTPMFDWSGRGLFHINYLPEEEVPLTSVSVLGTGGMGYVDAVMCGSRLLARKSIRLFKRTKRSFFEQIQAEVNIMRTLQHPHIVQVVGSYSNHASFSFLMSPVCEYDLAHFMRECSLPSRDPVQRMITRRNRFSLKRSMSCLAHAVEYMHDNMVRHNDIKPQNIVVKKGAQYAHMYFTDFGIGLDFSDLTSSMTANGGTRLMTRRYAAPEGWAWDKRGRSSDIYSLGCVFLEMQTTILGFSREEMQQCIGLGYGDNLDKLGTWINDRLRTHSGKVDGFKITPKRNQEILDLILGMMDENPSLRPRANQVVNHLPSNECCHLDVEEETADIPTPTNEARESIGANYREDESDDTLMIYTATTGSNI
ncbi:kinase-like protein [Patellaria atrata CBS 101060]|uniref:Kinase-like protein n=1 Tax=Patellaria atrata CBS 101060 TaxID=1346257 RepID=A0A9P4SD83_9PEZI|nr:kinase-like protein [Patellaria atrata CBS 101060]